MEETINGDVLLSSGIISYLGVFPIDFRESILLEWKELLTKT